MLQQFRRFFIFGLTCNIIYTVSIYLLTEKIKFHYIASVVIALIYTSFIGFCLNKLYTFNTSTKTFFPEFLLHDSPQIRLILNHRLAYRFDKLTT